MEGEVLDMFDIIVTDNLITLKDELNRKSRDGFMPLFQIGETILEQPKPPENAGDEPEIEETTLYFILLVRRRG